MFKPGSRIATFIVLVGLLVFGLAGCGSDGGLGGGIGGGAGNTPVISGTIDALGSGGRIIGVGSTDATGVVSITASALSGASYPLVLELYGGTGFAGTMYSVMESSATTSVYFSAFSTLWIKTAKAAAGSFEDITQAHLDAAKADVQSVYALLTNNAAATDFTTIDPLASPEMAMVHQIFDADSGAGNQDNGYTGFDTAIDSMVTGLTTGAGAGPLNAITTTFQHHRPGDHRGRIPAAVLNRHQLGGVHAKHGRCQCFRIRVHPGQGHSLHHERRRGNPRCLLFDLPGGQRVSLSKHVRGQGHGRCDVL
jgi:hypothetical protein